MKEPLKKKIEAIIGEVKTADLLEEQGWCSEVRKIVTANGIYLLKSSVKERYRIWLRTEAKLLEQLSEDNQIPVPKYYGFIEEADRSHLIMSFENGVSLTTALREAQSLSEKKSLIKSFGKFLQQFHIQKPFKLLEHEEDWLDRQLAIAQYYVDNCQTEGSQELLNQLKATKPSPIQPTMIHGDCTTDNVLVMNGGVNLFIDVAAMTVGDPRYDLSLAISDFVDNTELLDAFYEGYRQYRVSLEEFHYFDEGLYEFF